MYPVEKYENELLKYFKENRGCFYPECTCKKSDVIKSHTIQKRGNLSLIAEEGHVYQYKISTSAFKNFVANNHFSPPTRIGINVASTFLGFCASHDKQLFQEIEDCPLVPSIRQINLISFRSLCSELYRKNSAVDSRSVVDEFLTQSSLQSRSSVNDFELAKHNSEIADNGSRMGQSIMASVYNRFCRYLVDCSTSNLDYLLLKLDQVPQVLCSAYINPEIDFYNKKLQQLAIDKEGSQGIFLNIIVNSGTGYVLFSWEKNHRKMRSFVCSLIEQNDIINNTVALIFTYIENHVFKISWWESLSYVKKKDICNRVLEIYHLCKIQEPKKYVNWKFTANTNSVEIEKVLIDKGISIFNSLVDPST